MQNQTSSGKSSIGMDANVAAGLGYIIGIISIIVLCTEKENKFVKFHALQSILFHVGAGLLFGLIGGVVAVLFIVVASAGVAAGAAGSNAGAGVGAGIGIFGVLVYLFFILAGLAMFTLNIISAVRAFQGNIFRIPIVGNIAANFAKLDQ
jgi:uncharacterized membrane protein